MPKLHPSQVATLGQEAIADFREAHSVLITQCDTTLALRDKVKFASSDTIFAIGEAAGALSKAKALLCRDLDDVLAHQHSTSSEPAPLET